MSSKHEKWQNSLEGILYRLTIIPPIATNELKPSLDADNIIAETLLRLPKRVREKVLDECVFYVMPGAVGQSEKMVASGEHWGIFLNFPTMKGRTKAYKMNTVAHEIAHYRLKHNGSSDRGNEVKADDLCESWGFGRAYRYRRFT